MQEPTCEKRNKTVDFPFLHAEEIPRVGLFSVECLQRNCCLQSSLIVRCSFTTPQAFDT